LVCLGRWMAHLAHFMRRKVGDTQGLGKVPDCLVHGLVMPSNGQDLGGVAGVVA
jgi:hypothetical protein